MGVAIYIALKGAILISCTVLILLPVLNNFRGSLTSFRDVYSSSVLTF